jgi:hypothetical protein
MMKLMVRRREKRTEFNGRTERKGPIDRTGRRRENITIDIENW